MAQEPLEVKQSILEQRSRIGRSLDHIESDLDDAKDWKGYVRRHPWVAVGGAFGVGLLLAGRTSGGRSVMGGSNVLRQTDILGRRVDNLIGAAVGALSDFAENAVMDAFPMLRSRYPRNVEI